MKKIIFLFIMANVTLTIKLTAEWERIPFGDDIYSIIIKTNGDIFVGTEGRGVQLSTDNGNKWKILDNGFPFPFVSSLSVSDSNIYAGTFGEGVFLSTNYGVEWKSLNTGLDSLNPSGSVWSVVAEGTNVFVGTPGRGIFVSTNLGQSWYPINNGLPERIIFSICMKDTNIFISVTGIGSNNSFGIYLSTNKGEGWNEVNSGLSNLSIRTIVTNGTNLYAGTLGGVFKSTNNGESWESINIGITDFRILSLALNDKYLFAGTYDGKIFMSTNSGDSWKRIDNDITTSRIQTLAIGNGYIFAGTSYGSPKGIFRAKLSDIETSVADIPVNNNQISVYPNPASDYITISIPEINPTVNRRVDGLVDKVQIFDMLGLEVLSVGIGLDLSTQKIDVSHLPTGVYFIRIICSNGACSIVEKFVKQL
ncbi:MAG: T9SS type A sorting domain-containing protein [Candidatus Kapabacteria bacterium]|nr:T9SS type A sorting domain-containing protein [Ignavibacteriota bacterium]MCW5883554.1 T9SS type A sorting domain-containing protein [Candidatus Kapabacteria bacterium]